MFNQQRLDTIRKNIQISTLLSDHEKSDWLNLLELMNDKQLGELEDILAAESPVQISKTSDFKTPPTPISSVKTPPPATIIPPLSHIANVPSDVATSNTNTVSVVDQPLKKIEPNIVEQTPVVAKTFTPITQKAPAEPKSPKKVFVIQDHEQLQNLSVEMLREYDLQSIVNSIKDAIVEDGYFHVLQLIESSALYTSYIESGQLMLQNKPSVLSQSEFEFVTDLLRNMRFNRV